MSQLSYRRMRNRRRNCSCTCILLMLLLALGFSSHHHHSTLLPLVEAADSVYGYRRISVQWPRQNVHSLARIRGGAAPSIKSASSTVNGAKTKTSKTAAEDPRILWLIRLLFLSYYGSLGSLLPYLPVYYHSLGHGGQIIGLLGAVKPFTTFLVAPLWGLLADQSEKPFLILQLAFVVSLLGQLLVAVNSDALYLSIMVFLTALFNAPVKSLLDSMVMDHLRNPSASYGKLRLWGQMGFGLGSSAVGMLLHRSKIIPWPVGELVLSEALERRMQRVPNMVRVVLVLAHKFWTSLTGFKLLFLAHAALSVPTWLCIQAFRALDDKKQAERQRKKADALKNNQKSEAKLSEGILLLLQNADALLFFFLVFVVGVSSGVVENFAYVRMREVGGTGKEMGLSRLISSLAGAPMFWFSGSLTQALGADRVIVLSLLSYVARFVIYALMRNPTMASQPKRCGVLRLQRFGALEQFMPTRFLLLVCTPQC